MRNYQEENIAAGNAATGFTRLKTDLMMNMKKENQLDDMLKFGNTRKEIVQRAKELIEEEIERKVEAHTKVSIDAFEKGIELGRQEAIKEELKFLQSENMKMLIHDADIGCCHDECVFINDRIRMLKKMLPLKEEERKQNE